MTNKQTPLSKEQQQYLDETLERGVAFEEMIRTKGWEIVLSYYQNSLQTLTTQMITQEDKSIEEFEKDRREIIGIRKLINRISSDIETLNKQREENRK